ncbi:SURF1 family protein [Kamptonema cortianum]|jgi:surfeit locus 1 family protein|nr:SURF1 family protein [Geitlerinema splendidum]MDK3160025.1 SURF1 family protein [Kamptonema cortianum]
MKAKKSFFAFGLLSIFIFLGLGTWQVYRKAEKEAFLKSLERTQKTSPENLDSLKSLTALQPIFAQGHFLAEKTIFLKAKTHQGKSGVYVLNVFQTQEGKYLLVQRGWASSEITALPQGGLKVEGILRAPAPPTYFQPLNNPPTYFWIDMPLLSETLNVPLLPYYLVATSSFDAEIFPVKAFPSLANNHLQYALTWYFLAFALGIMLLWHKYFYLKR